MSSNFQDTEAGGEQTQYDSLTPIPLHLEESIPAHISTRYEASAPDVDSHKKSSGQLGSPQDHTTTDPSKTHERQEAKAEQAEQTAKSNRQEKDFTEGGMGGKTNVEGEAR